MTNLPRTCVLDASVGMKLFIAEEHSEDVHELFRQNLWDASTLYVPDLFFIECANVLWKKVRRGEYDEEEVFASLCDLRLLGLSVTPMSELMERALQIACRSGVTAYDASYAALAEALDVPLLTADEGLCERLGGPVDVRSLGEIS